MHVVDAARGRRLALVVEQMAEVVQQGCSDQRRVGAGALGRMRGLQRVLELRHGLAAVHPAAVAIEERADIGQRQRHGAGSPRCVVAYHGSEYVFTLVKLFIASCTPSL